MASNDIIDVFIAEAKEIFERLESDIIQLEENTSDREIINRIFRYVHTLKGSSGIAGFDRISSFTHYLENLLDDVRAGELTVDNLLIDLILESIDWVKEEIFTEEPDTKSQDKKMDGLVQRISAIQYSSSTTIKTLPKEENGSSAHPEGYHFYHMRLLFKDTIFEAGIDPLILVEELSELGIFITKNVLTDQLPDFSNLDPEKCYIGWEILLKSHEPFEKIKEVFLFVHDDNDIYIRDVTAQFLGEDKFDYIEEKKIGEILLEKGILSEKELHDAIALQEKEKTRIGDIIVQKGFASEDEVDEAFKEQEQLKKKIDVNTVRVDTGKLDKLLNLLGEIVIGQSSLTRIADDIADEQGFRLKNAVYALDRTTREFQEQIMSIRMIPIGPTFELYRRFIRDSAQSLGKQIKLTIQGGETELDKTVIEKIADPLKHMIRNSIDHGVETPEERAQTGKSAHGSLTLWAYHQEGNVFIEIIDDGKGISTEKIRIKAIKLGYIKSDEQVSKEKLISFLFMPGFSTAEKVGDLSGRGVGMDVVKTNIESLRGSVSINSEEGKGTVVRIKLPLTLAIIDGMLIRIGAHNYVVPLLSVVESIKPEKQDIKTVEGQGEVILVRGEYVSLIRLYDMFNIESDHTEPWDGLVIIVESGETKLGILVDELVGQQQIVIKSLDEFITSSRSISGASILGDGRVALIIDVHGLIVALRSL